MDRTSDSKSVWRELSRSIAAVSYHNHQVHLRNVSCTGGIYPAPDFIVLLQGQNIIAPRGVFLLSFGPSSLSCFTRDQFSGVKCYERSSFCWFERPACETFVHRISCEVDLKLEPSCEHPLASTCGRLIHLYQPGRTLSDTVVTILYGT